MVPNLQYLSLNENHLPRLTGLDETRLLQYLSIKQNNLQEVTEKIMLSLWLLATSLLVPPLYSLSLLFFRSSCSAQP